MILIDPVAVIDPTSPLDLTGATLTRASAGWYWDKFGVLQFVGPNTPRISYDPTDLTKPPFLLYEPVAATNVLRFSQQFDSTAWTKSGVTVTPDAAAAPDGTTTADALAATSSSSYVNQHATVQAGQDVAWGLWLRADTPLTLRLYIIFLDPSYALIDAPYITVDVTSDWQRFELGARTPGDATIVSCQIGGGSSFTSGEVIYAWGGQTELGVQKLSSYIPTTSAAATREADVITGTGLLFSSVPVTESAWSAGAAYAAEAVVVYRSRVYKAAVSNTNVIPPSDPGKWILQGVTNRLKMFDQYTNTQTTATDEILVVLVPGALVGGLHVGNANLTEVAASVVDATDGVVFSEARDLTVSDTQSSYYKWGFGRIQRKPYYTTLALPPYSNPIVTLALRNAGGTAACGVCATGPLMDVGLSQYDLSTEIKDFSTVNINPDGTTNEVLRGYAKRMVVDVELPNEQIDYVQQNLASLRQKRVVWVGADYDSATIFGKYSSFKNMIKGPFHSMMSLQVEGTV